MNTFSPSTHKAKAGELWILGQTGLHSEPISKQEKPIRLLSSAFRGLGPAALQELKSDKYMLEVGISAAPAFLVYLPKCGHLSQNMVSTPQHTLR